MLIYFKSIVKQVLQLLLISQCLIPDGNHRREGMREEKPVFPFNAERQARGALVPFFTSLVWRGQGLNPWPPTLEVDTLPLGYRGGYNVAFGDISPQHFKLLSDETVTCDLMSGTECNYMKQPKNLITRSLSRCEFQNFCLRVVFI